MPQNRELPDQSNSGEMSSSAGQVLSLSPDLEAYQAYASAIHPLLRPTLLAIGDSASLAEGRAIPGVGRVVEDHHLGDEPEIQVWGETGTLVEEVKRLGAEVEQTKGDALDFVEDSPKAPSDFVDSEAYTAGWGKGSEIAARLEAEGRARARRDIIEALREKREASLEEHKEHLLLGPKS